MFVLVFLSNSLLLLLYCYYYYYAITFMHAIYTQTPCRHTHGVPTVHNVAATVRYNICYMLCYFPRQTFCTLHQHFQQCAAPSVAVFCSSLMSSIPGTFRYFVNDFEMVPFAPTMTGTNSVLHCRCAAFSFFITFLSPDVAMSNNTNSPFS